MDIMIKSEEIEKTINTLQDSPSTIYIDPVSARKRLILSQHSADACSRFYEQENV